VAGREAFLVVGFRFLVVTAETSAGRSTENQQPTTKTPSN
jgi:hypothetical protein